MTERSIDDLLGEALRRHRHGLMRPLWRDLPENEKRMWRSMGARLLLAGDELEQATGLLREAAAKALSVRTAIRIMRGQWLASADRAAEFATDNPRTPEQWRAFGGVETQRALAGELDPEKNAILEPSDLKKAEDEIKRLDECVASLTSALAPFRDRAISMSDSSKRKLFEQFGIHPSALDNAMNALSRCAARESRS